MIVSPARKFIFVHIPKTGGTSLALALEDRAHKDDILIGDTPKAKRRKNRLKGLRASGRLWKHSSLADIDGVVSPQDLDDMFVFTLVRNPWDRMVSYYHWLRDQRFDHPAVELAQRSDFETFVLDNRTAETFRNAPFASYVTDASGTERDTTFVRLEALETDLAPVWAHLGFKLDIPHENRSHRPPEYQSAYSEDTAKAVADMCAEDIRRFGYHYSA